MVKPIETTHLRPWRNRQTRTFEGRVGNHTGSSPVGRTKTKTSLLTGLFLFLHRPDLFTGENTRNQPLRPYPRRLGAYKGGGKIRPSQPWRTAPGPYPAAADNTETTQKAAERQHGCGQPYKKTGPPFKRQPCFFTPCRYSPKSSFVCCIRLRMDTPKGQRFSQAPQPMQSEAWCSSLR